MSRGLPAVPTAATVTGPFPGVGAWTGQGPREQHRGGASTLLLTPCTLGPLRHRHLGIYYLALEKNKRSSSSKYQCALKQTAYSLWAKSLPLQNEEVELGAPSSPVALVTRKFTDAIEHERAIVMYALCHRARDR